MENKLKTIQNIPNEYFRFLNLKRDELGLYGMWKIVLYYLMDSPNFKKEFEQFQQLNEVKNEECEGQERRDIKKI